ncbi:MAG: type II secretion system F family protein [Methanobacteriaceae archaeon]
MNIFKPIFIKIADIIIMIISAIFSLPSIIKNSFNNSKNENDGSSNNNISNNNTLNDTVNNDGNDNYANDTSTKFDFSIVDAINDLNNTNYNSNINVNNNTIDIMDNGSNNLSKDSDGLIVNIISKIVNTINNNYDNHNNSNNGSSKFKAEYANNLNRQSSGFIEKYADFYKKVNLKVFIPVFVSIIVFLFIALTFIIGIEIAILMILLIFMAIFLIIRMPKMKKERSYTGVSNDLPYLLRQMVTELKSGKGLHDTMLAISNSDYGILSFEFSRVLEEIKYGESTENALIHMANRVKSDSLNRAVTQIIGTLRVGGDLSNTLNIIADDVSHDLQMKLKDYSQKLNAFVMLYTFLAILGPVIILIMVMPASTVMGDIVPPSLILVMYIVFFPMIVAFMGYMIKRLEPKL